MKLFAKITLALGVALCVAALALGGAGLAMGGRLGSFVWAHGSLVYEPYEPYGEYQPGASTGGAGGTFAGEPDGQWQTFTAENVISLDLDVDAAEVTLQQGDAFSVKGKDAPGLTARVDEDGEWEIQWKSRVQLTGGRSPQIVVTLPAGARLEEAELNIGAGGLEGEGLHTARLSCEVGAGGLILTGLTVEQRAEVEVSAGYAELSGDLSGASVDGECSMGELNITTTRPARYGYRVENSMGTVVLGGESFDGMTATGRRDEDAPVVYDLECSMGTVIVSFAG